MTAQKFHLFAVKLMAIRQQLGLHLRQPRQLCAREIRQLLQHREFLRSFRQGGAAIE